MTDTNKFLKNFQPIAERRRKLQIENTNVKKVETFNVYNILGVLSKEEKFHSSFLADLLNPKGKHGRKDLFLKEFLIIFGLSDFDFDTENAKVDIDLVVPLPETAESGVFPGQNISASEIKIDLHIKSGDKVIVIENKIYKGENFNQLLRYHNYASQYEHRLIYLTLDGSIPSLRSIGQGKNRLTKEQYIRASYRHNVMNWLERCAELSYNYTFQRETILQYLKLISQLTDQSYMDENKQQIINSVLKNPEHILTAILISETVPMLKTEIISRFTQYICDKLDLKMYPINDSEFHYMAFYYKSAILFFGGEKGRIFVSIKTALSMKGQATQLMNAEIFDLYNTPAFNPFGWTIVSSEHWDNTPERFVEMTQEDSPFQKLIEGWILKMKEAIDGELKEFFV